MKRQLGLALAACLAFAGCDQLREADPAGGGGGSSAALAPDVQQARERIGEAYVHAARMHAEAVRGDFDGAVGAIRDARKELGQAKLTARLDTQVRINEMDQVAIGVQRELERRSLTSYKATERFVGQMQGLLASVPARPAPGGGGGGAAVDGHAPLREAPSGEPLDLPAEPVPPPGP